jgi:uncharacterized membrane protein
MSEKRMTSEGATAEGTTPAGPGAPPASLEVALAHVLQVGTYVSVALIGAGSILLLASGGSPIQGGPPLDLGTLPADVLALRPAGLLWLGILGVLATPGLRVARALLGFARRGEQRMVVVSVLVLAVIAVGVIVGVMAR